MRNQSAHDDNNSAINGGEVVHTVFFVGHFGHLHTNIAPTLLISGSELCLFLLWMHLKMYGLESCDVISQK